MIQSMAEETSNQNGGLGLAQMLYEQMKRNFGTLEASGDSENASAIEE